LQEYEKNQLKKEKERDTDNLKLDPNAIIKEELEKSDREQKRLLKENKEHIIDFIIDNKNSIRVEELKIYVPTYECYREKKNCKICNNVSNILCKIVTTSFTITKRFGSVLIIGKSMQCINNKNTNKIIIDFLLNRFQK
jgi:hypothetical protein